MPRKPKREKKSITTIVNGKAVNVILHPPTANRRSWFAYWPGLVASKSTGQRRFEDAVIAVEEMLKSGGKRHSLKDLTISNDEFEAVQRVHFGRKTDQAAKARSAKTLEDCLDAIAAFKAITGLSCIVQATPDNCARFQTEALQRPKNWRKQHPNSQKTDECISPNTVLKWSRSLQAAFERVNRAAGKKCVRGVVDETKLLTSNPWTQFTWIEGTRRPIRQFDAGELLSLLDYLETAWARVPVAALAAKVFLWSACRKLEVASLTWDAMRKLGNEVYFRVVAKWGIERWFRLPEPVYHSLLAFRTESRFVFAAYTDQIRSFNANNPGCLRRIRDEFLPDNFGDWFYRRITKWSTKHPKGRAFVHHFRKTVLQHARRGEDINRQVAGDAMLGESVMMTSYVNETDEELRARSNRTFQRIVASLPVEVASRYGFVIENEKSSLEKRLEVAIASQDWGLAAAITTRLAQKRQPEAG